MFLISFLRLIHMPFSLFLCNLSSHQHLFAPFLFTVCLESLRITEANPVSLNTHIFTHAFTHIMQQCQPEQVWFFHQVFLAIPPLFLKHGYCKHTGTSCKQMSGKGLSVYSFSPQCLHLVINVLHLDLPASVS